MNTIEIELFEKDILWFEKYSTENMDTEIDLEMENDPDNGVPMLKIGNLYDYATLPDNNWEFYIDIMVKLPHMAAVMIRSQYRIHAKGFEWSHLFVPENLEPIVSNALMNSMMEFRHICVANDVNLSTEMKEKDPEITKEMITGICGYFIQDYQTYRKPYDIANKGALTEIELNCPMSTGTNVTLNLTFLVMEQILFNNRRFNRQHNREIFFKLVPEMKFYTLRMKCIQIGQHDVALTVEDVHYFLICMDCALQMILGDKADYLIPVLEERGANDEYQKLWFRNASKVLNICRKSAEESIKRNEKFDWSKMIR